MNLNQLRYFIAIVKHGSFGKAAEELNISQPALSNSIKKLEWQFKVDLLDRGPKGVHPTPYGQAIETFFQSAVDSYERALQEVELMKRGSRGHVTIGTLSGLMIDLVPEIIIALRERYPHFTYSVRFAYLDSLLEQLRDGHIDFVLATYWPEANITSDMTVRSFADMDLSIYCRPQHWLAGRVDVTLDDLAECEWIIPDSPGSRGFIKAIFGEDYRTTIKEPVLSGYVPFIHSMMLKSDMLGVVPSYFVEHFVRDGGLVRLDFDIAAQQLHTGLIYYQGRMRTPAMLAFVETATDVAKRTFARP